MIWIIWAQCIMSLNIRPSGSGLENGFDLAAYQPQVLIQVKHQSPVGSTTKKGQSS
jgi:hypothetical protein